MDWKHGGHRTACRLYDGYLTLSKSLLRPSYNVLNTNPDEGESNLFVREREFLRALVHHDYEKMIHSICAEQLKFTASNPTCELFLTLFDYCKVPPTIEVYSATGSPAAEALTVGAPEWSDMVMRAARSAGRMHLHVIRIFQDQVAEAGVQPSRAGRGRTFGAWT